MTPAVSVLLPCFDAAVTLEEALDSLWRQSFTDFEVIAVNDGSSDATGEILARAARADVRLQILETAHQRHRVCASNRPRRSARTTHREDGC